MLRQTSPSELLTVRPASLDDQQTVLRLIDDADRWFLTVSVDEAAGLLAGAPALLLLASGRPCGVIIADWVNDGVTWMRVLALSSGLSTTQALGALLPPFHATLRARNVAKAYVACHEPADMWLTVELRRGGYVHDTDVIVYEKTRMSVPTHGNPAVRVRTATMGDISAILAVDARCFTVEWRKDAVHIGTALRETPRFFVVEDDTGIIGYAFVTIHRGGRLVHLVRIAVLPDRQRQGIGARLLYEVVAYAAAIGAETITLNTQAYNRSARRLYEWFGFRRTGDRQIILRHDL
ncbi:MAG: GNAT family N-acetyltransferase [Roseiflexus sp.]|nr:GNAT family N-acetyltransferase [Roseiflexus sp.]MCS7287703.1 GNAT family N-acetyltransferase [Roseiflexus sp.]MDW8147902.1 GNAT family N-acetyltransferase [Roseiflexaceae bacterium]MDW8231937.1 GNAT family N-acetyltransferase [Roseiflexaceae bacterium]